MLLLGLSMNSDWKEKLDGYIFEWVMPSKWWEKLQHKARLWQEWLMNRIEEKLK